MMANVPTTRGTPASANSKNPKRPSPAAADASDTRTFTGDPVSASMEPELPAKASGIASCDGDCPLRIAMATVMGRSAATEPLSVMSAVRTALIAIVNTSKRLGSSPTCAMSR